MPRWKFHGFIIDDVRDIKRCRRSQSDYELAFRYITFSFLGGKINIILFGYRVCSKKNAECFKVDCLDVYGCCSVACKFYLSDIEARSAKKIFSQKHNRKLAVDVPRLLSSIFLARPQDDDLFLWRESFHLNYGALP
ncbi:MAG: hypothetical protein VYC40_01880 [Pseudomonadota bacterium]|nr:hypothetical protein [Pseudomonadota bacterium]